MLIFVRLSVCPVKSVLELTIFIFLSWVSLRSVSGQSLLGHSVPTSSDRRSQKYFVLLALLQELKICYSVSRKINSSLHLTLSYRYGLRGNRGR